MLKHYLRRQSRRCRWPMTTSEPSKNDKAPTPYFSEELRPLIMGPTDPHSIDEQVQRFIIDRRKK